MKRAIKSLAAAVLFLIASCIRNEVVDADGNRYHMVKIGKQVWMVENFRSTRFNDGSPIPHVADSVAWHSLSTPGYCYYQNTSNPDTIKMFGALYNWYCVNSEKFAPEGWRVPSNEDWMTLQNYLIKKGYNWDGVKRDNHIAKALAAKKGWKPHGLKGMPGNEMQKNNRSGFSAVGAGFRYDSRDSVGWYPIFGAVGHKAGWWSATEVNESIATVYGMAFCVDYLIEYQQWLKTCGYSVRLIKKKQ